MIANLRCTATDPPCFVFHPNFPMPELLDATAAAFSLFGHSVGLPFTDSFGVLQTPYQLSWANCSLLTACPLLLWHLS
jgi:hypothetical protein